MGCRTEGAVGAIALLALLVLPGCQTDRDGVKVNLTAALRAYRARLDRTPTRREAQRIIALLPADQLNDLGVLYEREGRLDDAAWAYQEAVWRDLRFAPAYVNLGNVLRKQGKPDEALQRYRQAMAADPANFEAANNFGDLCAELNAHLGEAVERLEPLVQQEGPHRGYGLDTLGWLRHLRGEDDAALALLERALAEVGDDLELALAVHAHLAAVCAQLGRREEAAAHCAEQERIRALLRRGAGAEEHAGNR
jgi:tetratricopeptide (TPR) repeat protein